jgi:transposase-like protein
VRSEGQIVKKAVYIAIGINVSGIKEVLGMWVGGNENAKYPKIGQSWRANWATLSTYFKYPQEVRTLIYTTNVIEGFNRQLRKVIKSKSVFPTDDSLLKMLYLAMMDIKKKWTGKRKDWGIIHCQLEVFLPTDCPDNTYPSLRQG